VDALANIGCSLDYETLYYDVCPTQLSDLVAADSMGISTPRMIFVFFFLGLCPHHYQKKKVGESIFYLFTALFSLSLRVTKIESIKIYG
jgi:hypothetical protein